MTGNDSILILTLPILWRSWKRFRRGKRDSYAINTFQYHLETELPLLLQELQTGRYVHGPYVHFETTDTKRRCIAVAQIRDRVVHRLLYDYLVRLYDKTFFYDVWSCRTGKGLLRGIERTQDLLHRYHHSWVLRSDVRKFFDHIDHGVLKTLLRRRVHDERALRILDTVIDSYPPEVGSSPADFRDPVDPRFGDAKSREREREREQLALRAKAFRLAT